MSYDHAPGKHDSSFTDNPGINKIGPQAMPSDNANGLGPVDSWSKLEGANPGRDQDRSRVDECQGSTYR